LWRAESPPGRHGVGYPTRSRRAISQATNRGNAGSCDFAALAHSAHDLSIARCRWFEHSRNGAVPRGANRNSEGTARQSSYEIETSYSEELPGKRQAIHVQSPTGMHRDRARRRCCALTDLLKDQSFSIKELLVDS